MYFFPIVLQSGISGWTGSAMESALEVLSRAATMVNADSG